LRPCYLDEGVIGGSVAVDGVADSPVGNTAQPTLGALFCVRPTTSAVVNIVAGLPGLGRLTLPGTITLAEEVVADVASPGGTVTTDGEADGATASDPVETSVTTPTGGEVIITETFVSGATPPGFAFFGRQVQISALAGSVASPLTLVFLIDASVVPSGEDETTVDVFKDGVLVPACTGAPQAIPNPCVSGRAVVGDDIQLTVLSATASDWNFAAVESCPATPQVCRTPAVAEKAALLLKDKSADDKDLIVWKWLKGKATTKAEFGDPLTSEAYLLCIYDDGSLVSSTRVEAAGICAGNPCWADKPTGFKFKDKELTPDGAQLLLLKEGYEDGDAGIVFKGKGVNLDMPNLLALGGPIDVNLHKASGGVCWGATYSGPPTKNDGETFKDKAD
jgi:hypothetical protein